MIGGRGGTEKQNEIYVTFGATKDMHLLFS
jgi:hypothetical protein